MRSRVLFFVLASILVAISIASASHQRSETNRTRDPLTNSKLERSVKSHGIASSTPRGLPAWGPRARYSPFDLTALLSGASPTSFIARNTKEKLDLHLASRGDVGIHELAATSPQPPADCGIGIHSWSYTGSISSALSGHTSTILPNGKVLIVGAVGTFTGVTGYVAELYDPVSGTWSSAGSPITPRILHTATLLPNGKVLIAGGTNQPNAGVLPGLRSAELYDPSTNTWSSTTSLSTPRSGHTATLLSDGKVLVWGGYSNLTTLAAPELYDFFSGTWSTTGSGATPRTQHTATLLTNGKVLVAGGVNNNILATAQLYDPTSGTVTNTASLATPRSRHTATLLGNGKVLVVRGANAELYDPVSATWTTTPNLNVARQLHTATLLSNGQVLVAGGAVVTDPTLNTYHYCSELYDPATGLWSPTGNLNTGRGGHTAVLLTSGKVLVIGGRRYNENLSSAELYDPGATEVVYRISGQIIAPSANQLVAVPGATVTISGSASGATISNTVDYYFNNLQAGGNYTISATREGYKITPSNYTFTNLMSDQVANFDAIPLLTVRGHVVDASGNGLANADLFLSAQGSCSETIKTSTDANGDYTFGELDVRNFPFFTPLQVRVSKLGYLFGTSVVVIGRPPPGDAPFSAVANFAAVTCGANWSNTGNLNFGRSGHTATLLGNGKVLVAGGDADSIRAELYDVSSGTWTITGSLNNGRTGHTATLLSNGKVLVVSGTSAELYDPALGTWAITGSLANPRSGHTATLLGNGKVLVTSGTSAELYDPALGTWSVTGNLTTSRSGHTATLLGNGKVLVASGTSAELYDPVSRLWTVTGSLNFSRTGFTATLLNTGKVLVAGGIAELYDPASGTWSVTGSPSRSRSNHTATLLPSGAVLVVGGTGSGSSPCFLGLVSAEIYNPTSGTWSDAGGQCNEAVNHTATLLPTGKVLVVGFPSAPTHAELYFSNAAVCAFTLNSSSASAPASGGSGNVSFTATASDCPWTAVSNNGFITITSATSGTGNGTISYSVTANPGSSAQSGTLTIAGQTFTVNQAGVSCAFVLGSNSASLSASGGSGSVSFTGTASNCPWTAVSNSAFINITSAIAGTGNGAINYSVTANPSSNPRTGTLTIAGQTFTVMQAGVVPCSFSVSPTSQSFNASAWTDSVAIIASAPDCGWTANSNASFITIMSLPSGTGNGTLSYSVGANSASEERSGTITIGGQTFTVNQAAPTWEAAVLTSGQSEIKTWTVGGRTYAYVKLLYPNGGYRVTTWGQPTRVGNDFTVDAAIEKFSGTSVQAVTTTAQIYDLGPLTNGTYNFNFKTSGTLTKTLQFIISSTVPPPNPIDDARQFVKQQYRDFLNREADQAGEDFWTDNITKCNDPARRPGGQTVEQCTLRQRETTSGAFFMSPEFQYTGYFVYRMYVGALGRPPKLSEFVSDAQFVGNGIIVNGQLSGAKINENKAAFAAQFVNCVDATKYRCAEFKGIYDGLSDLNYVNKLFLNTGVNASASDRQALLVELNANLSTGRATVLQKVVDGINVISEGNQQFTTSYGQAFYNSELNRAFVQLEYFGYMKRDPDEAGYAFWLAKLNQFGGNFVNAEMVLAFISSPEYRARFGQP